MPIMSSRTRIAPIVIAESATLNAQKCVAAPVDVDEIDDVAGDGAVDQVAERAAEDEREPEARHPLVEPELRRVGGDRHQRDRGDADHHQPVCTGKSAAFSSPNAAPGVVDVRQVEKLGDDARGSRRAAASCGRSPSSSDRARRRPPSCRAPADARSAARARPAARRPAPAAPPVPAGHQRRHPATGPLVPGSASTQRSHSPAVSRADETVGTMRQQRGHFSPSARATSTSTLTPSAAPRARARRCETMNSIGRSSRYRSSSAASRRRLGRDLRAERVADRLRLPLGFERAVDLVADSHQPLPARDELGSPSAFDVAPGNRPGAPTPRVARQVAPQLVGRHRQDRREQPCQPVGDHVHRRLRRRRSRDAAPNV